VFDVSKSIKQFVANWNGVLRVSAAALRYRSVSMNHPDIFRAMSVIGIGHDSVLIRHESSREINCKENYVEITSFLCTTSFSFGSLCSWYVYLFQIIFDSA
jgi:hypothetical protein